MKCMKEAEKLVNNNIQIWGYICALNSILEHFRIITLKKFQF